MRKWLEYIPFLCITTLARLLPRATALSLGKQLGRLAKLLQGRRVKIARDNLQHAFPEMSPEEISRTVTKMFEHLGTNSIDMLRLDKYRRSARFRSVFQGQWQRACG